MRRTFLVAALLPLLLAAAPANVPAPAVHMRDDAFVPKSLTVVAGASVTFVNDDDDAHTVTSTSNEFDSKGIDSHKSWRHTFSKPGTYAYFCELHPFMKATIVVKARQ